MKRRLLLDVVVGEGAAVFELLAGEDQALLVRGNALLICGGLDGVAQRPEELRTLNLALDIVNGVAGLHLEGDSLARDCRGSVLLRSQCVDR
jgi:hypothetical protein